MRRNRLSKADEALFKEMQTHFKSEREKTFFEKLRYKQENEISISHDLILSELNNEDGIYIVRCEFEEYIVGKKDLMEEQHVMTLYEALNLNLRSIGFSNEDITLLQWLRKRDYAGVEYNHNYDLI